jgi:hypothetical protein
MPKKGRRGFTLDESNIILQFLRDRIEDYQAGLTAAEKMLEICPCDMHGNQKRHFLASRRSREPANGFRFHGA